MIAFLFPWLRRCRNSYYKSIHPPIRRRPLANSPAQGRQVIDFLGAAAVAAVLESQSISVSMSIGARLRLVAAPLAGLPPRQPAEEARRGSVVVAGGGERVLAAEADDGLDEHRAVDGEPQEEAAAAPGKRCPELTNSDMKSVILCFCAPKLFYFVNNLRRRRIRGKIIH